MLSGLKDESSNLRGFSDILKITKSPAVSDSGRDSPMVTLKVSLSIALTILLLTIICPGWK